jgi:hypothetical protein
MKPSSKLWIVAAGLFVLFVVLLIKGAGPRITDPGQMQRAANVPFPPGSSARLIYEDGERFPAFKSEAIFWNANDAIGRKDKTELSRIILDNESEMLPAGTEVVVRTYNPRGVAEIELPDGRRLWLQTKFLHK